jgi:hypothetical protein
MSDETKREHVYHAEATVLTGHLRLPFAQKILPQTYARLCEQGGYLSQHADRYRLEGVISFQSAYTQVAGNRELKPDLGWNTLTTSVVEGLNVLDIVTADRVVAQISTDHPPVGYVPSVTFLGTRFENLRIAGHPVKLDLDLNILGSKPGNDAPYTSDSGFTQRVKGQYERIGAHQNLPADVFERYNQLPAISYNQESIECSLINQAEGSYPGRSFGHVIDIPDFGKIYLATLRLEQSDFQPGTGIPRKTLIRLTMIKLEMGCVADGSTSVSELTTNGHTKP